MLRTVTAFRKYLREKYLLEGTDIVSLRAINALMITGNIKLTPEDTQKYAPINIEYKNYDWQVIFLGVPKGLLPQSKKEILKLITDNLVSSGTYNTAFPMTYNSAERWLQRHKYTKYKEGDEERKENEYIRTFISKGEPRDLLSPLGSTNIIYNEYAYDKYKGPWFIYELNINSTVLTKTPYTKIGDTTYLLVKSPTSKYITVKQKLREALIKQAASYERIITLLATHNIDTAVESASIYMSLLFERQGTVDKDALLKAYNENKVYEFVQDPTNLKSTPEQMEEIREMHQELGEDLKHLFPQQEKISVSEKQDITSIEQVEQAQAKLKNMQDTYNKRERLDDVFGFAEV